MQDPNTVIALFVVGAGSLVGYFEFRKKGKRIIDNGIEVEGIVFDFVNDLDRASTDRVSTPMPLIRFVTKDGVWMTEKGDWGSTSLNLEDKVIVVYNADNPKQFIYRTSKDWGHLMRYLFLISGIVCLAISLWLAYQYLTNDG